MKLELRLEKRRGGDGGGTMGSKYDGSGDRI